MAHQRLTGGKDIRPQDFLRTLYLGDRACKAILLDGWGEQVKVQVNQISRVRSPDGRWNFYSEEDIVDGFIVFSGVSSVVFAPPGPLPMDFISDFVVEPLGEPDSTTGGERFLFRMSIGANTQEGRQTEVEVAVTATGIHLEDPARPGAVIAG